MSQSGTTEKHAWGGPDPKKNSLNSQNSLPPSKDKTEPVSQNSQAQGESGSFRENQNAILPGLISQARMDRCFFHSLRLTLSLIPRCSNNTGGVRFPSKSRISASLSNTAIKRQLTYSPGARRSSQQGICSRERGFCVWLQHTSASREAKLKSA